MQKIIFIYIKKKNAKHILTSSLRRFPFTVWFTCVTLFAAHGHANQRFRINYYDYNSNPFFFLKRQINVVQDSTALQNSNN